MSRARVSRSFVGWIALGGCFASFEDYPVGDGGGAPTTTSSTGHGSPASASSTGSTSYSSSESATSGSSISSSGAGNGGGGSDASSSSSSEGGAGGEGGQSVASSGGGTSSTGNGGGGAEPSCSADRLCVDEAPDGWSGPFVLHEDEIGTPLPDCALTNYPATIKDYIGLVTDGDTLCDCGCEPAENIVCSETNAATICFESSTPDCGTNGCAQSQALRQGCNIHTFGSFAAAGVTSNPPVSPGSCEEVVTAIINEPSWALEGRACGGVAGEAHADCQLGAVCLPLPPEPTAKLCIAQPGEVACPAGTYSDQRIRYEGVEDERTCTACSCGGAASTCGGRAELTTGSGCATYESEMAVGSCGAVAMGTSAIRGVRYIAEPSGSCEPSGGLLQGEVARNGTTTLCCRT